jgi:antitoxin MazE
LTGNSRGIRIPKPLLEECGLGPAVDLEVRDGHLVISRATCPRSGWAESFGKMAARGDDTLLDAPSATAWERRDWAW